MKAFFRACLLAALFLCVPSLRAADTDTNTAWLAEHYTKYEHRIPMRDGVRLFTRVYVPKDESQKWPVILTRTPYALKPYGSDNYTDPSGSFLTLAKDRFILVTQDVRGRYGSEGNYVHVRPFNPNKGPKDIDENSDTWDTIEWLVKHVPNNSGLVGMFGISYPGFYTSMGMIDSHPALKAASPQAPIADWFMGDDLHHNGAFFLAQNFDFFFRFAQKVEDPLHDEFRSFNFKTPDGYDFFLRMGPLANSDKVLLKGRAPEWTEFLTHPTYDDYWKARNIRPHLKNVRCAVMTVGGWFDAEDLFGPLETYRATERQNPGITNLLVMGPWAHGGWGRGPGDTLGSFSFHAKASEYYREKIELPFFRHFLKGDTNYTTTEAHIFETGTHVWRKFDAWPPKQAVPRTLYLRAGGTLAFSPPTEGTAFDEYVSDPAKPVPFTADQSTTYPRAYPIEDQRFVASRTDVLVYETEPLEEDLTFAGPLHATFHVSTTGTDSDWVIKLIDVYPGDYPNPNPNPANVKLGGAQQLVRGDVFRGKFRNSFEKPEPFVPGKPAKIAFAIPDVCHTFRRGHRVMIQMQSSWFPLVDRNPQTFVNIPTAKPEDYRKATQRVYRSASAPTALTVQVLPTGK
ncbi:MAG: CocE/NonD family hydrolase [Proteobacteria bacterium]|nr:CocE/NonD family hydrolase [Pseudomonadota bacterium]